MSGLRKAITLGAIASLALFSSLRLVAWLDSRDAARGLPSGQGAKRLAPLWPLPEFDLPNQDGSRTTRRDLLGKVWIGDFIYTQCTSACPLITAKMALLQRELPARQLGFLSFSVDPEHDTPEVLRSYAQLWRKDEPRWVLLSTTPDALTRLAREMRVTVAKGDTSNPVVHSSLFFLADAQGQVRGLYDSDDEAAVRRLEGDARALLGTSAGAAQAQSAGSPGEEGRALFQSLGCAGCHDRPKLAPDLRGLWGQRVTLSTGQSVLADERYLRSSVLAPGADMVAGYAPLMPSYEGKMSSQELDALIAYLKHLPAPEGASRPATPREAAPSLGAARDPVCGMLVGTNDDALQVAYHGKTFHFCSQRCKAEFQKHPRQ